MFEHEHIIQHAAEMFVRGGVKAVRMDDVARSLGMSKRTLYEMFGDKENLLERCIRLYFEQEQSRFTAIGLSAGNVLEALLRVISALRENYAEISRLRDEVCRYYPKVAERLKAHGDSERSAHLNACLVKGIEEGYFDPQLPLALTVALLEYNLQGVATRNLKVEVPGMTPDRIFEQALIYFLRGISTAKGLDVIENYLKRKNQ